MTVIRVSPPSFLRLGRSQTGSGFKCCFYFLLRQWFCLRSLRFGDGTELRIMTKPKTLIVIFALLVFFIGNFFISVFASNSPRGIYPPVDYDVMPGGLPGAFTDAIK